VIPIPFFPQEHLEACVPACVRMVLAGYGLIYSEADLYNCCETDVDGTLPSAAVRCLQRLGLSARAERLSDMEALARYATDAIPIVFINLAPLLGIGVIHAVIVEEMDVQQGRIKVIDPSFLPDGRRMWTFGLFQMGWKLALNQTILIS